MLLFKTLLVLFTLTEVDAKPWVSEGDKGWLWYKEEPPIQKEEKKQPPRASNTSESSAEKTYGKQIEDLRAQFEEALSKSILVPSLENVKRTKTLHDRIIKQSEEFSKLWVLASLMEKGGAPSNAAHQRLYREKREEQLIQKVKALAKTYGLFFVFKEDCPYCHEFAPIVMKFVETMGFEFKAISGDGGTIQGLKNVSRDNGALKVINPEGVYPALFLANPKTLELIPVARGLISWSQLLENFNTILDFMETQHEKR